MTTNDAFDYTAAAQEIINRATVALTGEGKGIDAGYMLGSFKVELSTYQTPKRIAEEILQSYDSLLDGRNIQEVDFDKFEAPMESIMAFASAHNLSVEF